MTARLMTDRRKLSDEERKQAYADRFKPRRALPDEFELGRETRPPPRMVCKPIVEGDDIEVRDLVRYARGNSVRVIERLYEIAMADDWDGDPARMKVTLDACAQFLNRIGMFEVKGKLAEIYAKVQEREARIAQEEKQAKTIDVDELADGLGPKGTMR